MSNSHYMEILKSLERLREETMKRMYEQEPNMDGESNPMAAISPLTTNDYPVFQFSYDGLLPLYKENDREYMSFVRNYYYRITNESNENQKNITQFDKASIVISYYFQDKRIRDLDNRNRKVIIDAIRHTNIIKDDCWKNISIFEEGYSDNQNHIQVYLLERSNLSNFLAYLEKYHQVIRQIPKAGEKKEIEKEFSKGKQANTLVKPSNISMDETSGIWE
ncbi:hypothetical protein CIL03_08455 [Virgibacillus indicus]|uniref:Uncharacterized protein n=1 Tax=Virgibacillus indicus TaxID=2024554 RepID=A0A265NC46_9BACI|nr:hypothetical protein [Virgibacillus indicus]OZU89039.1 hypothetical protein CIL03_08455 [Virgibacillus indicus]